MGYEMGFSIVRKCVRKCENFDLGSDEVACLNYWCSSGKSIFNYVGGIAKPCGDDDFVVVSHEDLQVVKAKLNAAYSGSDIVGTETMKYLLDGVEDPTEPEGRDYIVTKAKGIHADVHAVLAAVNNFYWNSGEMDYETFIQLREFINGIVNMDIQDGYELLMWRSY